MDLRIEPLEKSIETIMFYNKERENIECPICHKTDWEILDNIRRPIAQDSHLCICKNCGFISYNPQLPNLLEYYKNETKPQTVGFLQTKGNKVQRHERLIFKYLKENDYEIG